MAGKEKTNGHVPVLDGWVTADQAAVLLGVSRQTAARIFHRRDLRTIHAVGERPLYVARVEEVKRLRALYEEASKVEHTHREGTSTEETHAHPSPEAWATAIEELRTQRPERIGAGVKQWMPASA